MNNRCVQTADALWLKHEKSTIHSEPPAVLNIPRSMYTAIKTENLLNSKIAEVLAIPVRVDRTPIVIDYVLYCKNKYIS